MNNHGDLNFACAWALVDRLAAGGVQHACVSPGSRSTPLALALERHPGITTHIHLDERSSAFFALGIAKATGEPVIAACTSGTAAAEFFPAVVEASQSRVPLVLLTADRPPRLRGTGANQTIDQEQLYGRYARAWLEPPVPGLGSGDDASAWAAVGEAALTAMHALPGPVQINCPFEEPLTPSPGISFETNEPAQGADVAGTVRERRPVTSGDIERFLELVSGRRGVLVAGSSSIAHVATAAWFTHLGWPVLAEPTSGLRMPSFADAGIPAVSGALAAGQSLISSSTWLDTHRPEVVVQIGATPVTRATQALVGAAESLVVIDRLHLDPDVGHRSKLRLHAEPDEMLTALGVADAGRAPDQWTDEWAAADAVARRALDEFLDGDAPHNELRLARDLAAEIPAGGTLFVGNSMPIRDLDFAMAPREGLRVLANRGASGIDGLVSTALGIAAGRRESPTFALIGDLSLLYDVGALLWHGGRAASMPDATPATFVIPNNGGGSIFGFLSQVELPEHERLFTTPSGVDLDVLCAAAKVDHVLSPAKSLKSALTTSGSIKLVEVRIDQQENRTAHYGTPDIH